MLIRDLQLEDAEAVARLHVQTWHETYRGMIPDEMLDRMNVLTMLPFWQKELAAPTAALHQLGAYAAQGDLVGLCSAGKARNKQMPGAELWAINIPREHQKRGVGKALLLEAMRRVHSDGEQAMHLWVVDINVNAIDFYLHCHGQRTEYEKSERSVREVAIVWPQLKAAIDAMTSAQCTPMHPDGIRS